MSLTIEALGMSGNSASEEQGVRLGPDLPVDVFTSTDPWHAERIGALAVYCSDGRWGEAFDEFCHKWLQIPRYDRWAVPGGPAWLARSGDTEFTLAAKQQLDFLIRVHELERIVLITHYGCAAYTEQLRGSAEDCLPAQIDDLDRAAATLRAWYGGIQIETYLAMRCGRVLSFHKIDVAHKSGGSKSEPGRYGPGPRR